MPGTALRIAVSITVEPSCASTVRDAAGGVLEGDLRHRVWLCPAFVRSGGAFIEGARDAGEEPSRRDQAAQIGRSPGARLATVSAERGDLGFRLVPFAGERRLERARRRSRRPRRRRSPAPSRAAGGRCRRGRGAAARRASRARRVFPIGGRTSPAVPPPAIRRRRSAGEMDEVDRPALGAPTAFGGIWLRDRGGAHEDMSPRPAYDVLYADFMGKHAPSRAWTRA